MGEVFELSGSARYCASHPNHTRAVLLGALRAAAELALLADDHTIDQEEREIDFGSLAAEIYKLACTDYRERRADEAAQIERWLRG